MIIQKETTQHVVAIPYPAQGHINSMLQLCQQLAPFGFSFTFINTHHIHQRVQHARRISAAYDAHHDVVNTHGGQGAHHELDGYHSGNAHPHTPDRYDDAHHEGPACVHAHPVEVALSNDAHQDNGYSRIHMVFVAGGQPPEHHGQQSSWKNVFNAAQEMQDSVEQVVTHMMQERGVAFILSDIMFRWAGTTAHKFNLPWVGFWPASAATCSALLHFSDLAGEGKGIPVVGEDRETAMMEGIPGLPPMHLHDVPKVWDSQTSKWEFLVLEPFAAVKTASCLLLNTFEELEGMVLAGLRKRLPTMALGPLVPSRYLLHNRPITNPEPPPLSLFPEDGRCLPWLDRQPPSSVLFISFGSISLRTEQQLQELALGVEASGCPFLWVRRQGASIGFTHFLSCAEEDDTHPADNGNPRGLTVRWAPQLQVLSHPSVGGFMTHCGWNSVMESVSLGVPMLCWADTGERMSNQRFVVECWKCGVGVAAGRKRASQNFNEGPMLVGRDEVQNSVRFLMLEDGGAPIRARAEQLKAVARRAFEDSQTQFKEFVRAMDQKRPPMSTRCSLDKH